MSDDNDSGPGKKLRQNEQLLEASSIGLMFPIAMGIGYAWGWGMDKLFHTKPWLTWIFTGHRPGHAPAAQTFTLPASGQP